MNLIIANACYSLGDKLRNLTVEPRITRNSHELACIRSCWLILLHSAADKRTLKNFSFPVTTYFITTRRKSSIFPTPVYL